MEKLLVIPSREKDLGGFSVRRVLPYARRRMVGPFLFLDHMGPAEFRPGQGINVRPHPHIHLATVTYLFEGKVHHRDSLGSDQLIEPGAINWMTAGRGIVHSERTPADLLSAAWRLDGIQCWVALPAEHENVAPSFAHHPASSLPEFELAGAKLKLLLGKALGFESPVRVHSDLFYLDVKMEAGATLTLPCDGREGAAYLAKGALDVNGVALPAFGMAVGVVGEPLVIQAKEASRFVLLGGSPVGERFMDWNFVSSRKESIEEARAEWRKFPASERFPKVPGDEQEFIPLPEEPAKGTIL